MQGEDAWTAQMRRVRELETERVKLEEKLVAEQVKNGRLRDELALLQRGIASWEFDGNEHRLVLRRVETRTVGFVSVLRPKGREPSKEPRGVRWQTRIRSEPKMPWIRHLEPTESVSTALDGAKKCVSALLQAEIPGATVLTAPLEEEK